MCAPPPAAVHPAWHAAASSVDDSSASGLVIMMTLPWRSCCAFGAASAASTHVTLQADLVGWLAGWLAGQMLLPDGDDAWRWCGEHVCSCDMHSLLWLSFIQPRVVIAEAAAS